MDVSKAREMLMKSLNERKAIKKESKSGASEFTPVLDKVKCSKENETKEKEVDELKSESLTPSNDTKEKGSAEAKDTTQKLDDKDSKIAETPVLFQTGILDFCQINKAEFTEGIDLKIGSMTDTLENAKSLQDSDNKDLELIVSLLKETSEITEKGQPATPIQVQGKLNEVTDTFYGFAQGKDLERIKHLLMKADQGQVNSVSLENVNTDLANVEEIVKSELAQAISAKKETASSEVNEADLIVNNINLSTEQENLQLQDPTLKIEEEMKTVEKFSTKLKVTGSTEDKAEKLLKSIMSDDKAKGHKDNVNDKLFNFLTQFDSVNSKNEVKIQEGFTVNKNNLSQDIIKAVKFMQINDMKDLTVKIAPKELGEVIIKLTMDKGVMKASLSTSNKEAYGILSSNLADMNQKLNHSDIKIQEFSINIYNGDTTFFSEEFNRQHQHGQDRRSNVKTFTSSDDNKIDIVENTAVDTSNVNILA